MKSLLYFLSMLAILIATSALAEQIPYTQPVFDKLIKESKPVLVEVHADWCSTCRAQAGITDALLREKPYRGIRSLRVDYDSQKDVVRALHVPIQSTLIVFKGGKEVGRSLGDTSREGIENLLKKAI
ncbi:MAG TPA: thioredoxin family protein [Novimethylophilus sp.]|jgi:thiol-disulfide isomerase/thioredoxin|uniref:thioredoxin family protein n=1 Tax=Novimethylophilus sp. TaxID=2137426 RepID=UPI002F419B38